MFLIGSEGPGTFISRVYKISTLKLTDKIAQYTIFPAFDKAFFDGRKSNNTTQI